MGKFGISWTQRIKTNTGISNEQPAFKTTWKTDNSGTSADNQITLPLESGFNYDFVVQWGDGTSDRITSWNQADKVHTYPSAGTYQVSITGVSETWRFDNSIDRRKILSVDDWGEVVWSTFERSFFGCSEMVSVTGKGWSSQSATVFDLAWRECRSLKSFPLIDVSSGQSFVSSWHNCNSLESFPLLNLSSARFLSNAWRNNSALSVFPAIDLSNAISMQNAWFQNSNMTEFLATGISTDITLSMNLDANALNFVYSNLAVVASRTIDVTGNPGVNEHNPGIATAKGWSVVSS